MTRITDEMIKECYRSGIEIGAGRAILHHERDRIAETKGMNQASASYYLSAVVALLSNGNIAYDINQKAVKYYLEKIGRDFGKEAQLVAARVCMRRYEETHEFNKTCHYYRRIAERYLMLA